MSRHYEAVVFDGGTIQLDGDTFVDCTFRNCTLVLAPGEFPKIERCHFDGISWQFGEQSPQSAERTLEFLKSIYQFQELPTESED